MKTKSAWLAENQNYIVMTNGDIVMCKYAETYAIYDMRKTLSPIFWTQNEGAAWKAWRRIERSEEK